MYIKDLLRIALGLSQTDEIDSSMAHSRGVPGELVRRLGAVINMKARVVDEWQDFEMLLLETYTPASKKGYCASLNNKINHLAMLARNNIQLQGIESSIKLQLIQYDRTNSIEDAEELKDGLEEVTEQIELLKKEMGELYTLIKEEKLYIGIPLEVSPLSF